MKYIAQKNMTLLEALELGAPDSSKSTLRSWIKQGRIQVDGEIVKNSLYSVQAGQAVSLASRNIPVEKGLAILYEDRHIVVVNKPAGLLSVSTNFDETNTAHAVLKRKYRPHRVYVVHRLDQDTSGVMLFALSEKALEELKKIFELHKIERRYDAVVEGHPEEESGTWRSYLVEDEYYMVRETLDKEKGELAVTHYTVIGKSKNHSWLDIMLETGKKNQIRVHCQSAKIPVSGDKKYGAKGNPLKRLCLHARILCFNHPITGKAMRFEIAPPASFYRLVNLEQA